MKIVCTGSRAWEDSPAIHRVLRDYYDQCWRVEEPFRVAVGDCPTGADLIVRGWCASYLSLSGFTSVIYNADWQSHGLQGGLVRNIHMLKEEQPDLVLAFRSMGKSNGTDHCIRTAAKLGLEVLIHMEKDAQKDAK